MKIWRFLLGIGVLCGAALATALATDPFTAEARSTSASAPRLVLIGEQTKSASGVISGVWEGTITSGGNQTSAGLVRLITLILTENGDKITGSYGCAPNRGANSFCRNNNETGYIRSATLKGDRFTAKITVYPDFSDCVYSGVLANSKLEGNYTCYNQGALVERGTWRAIRAGEEMKPSRRDAGHPARMAQSPGVSYRQVVRIE